MNPESLYQIAVVSVSTAFLADCLADLLCRKRPRKRTMQKPLTFESFDYLDPGDVIQVRHRGVFRRAVVIWRGPDRLIAGIRRGAVEWQTVVTDLRSIRLYRRAQKPLPPETRVQQSLL
jgi:hypothetical protein